MDGIFKESAKVIPSYEVFGASSSDPYIMAARSHTFPTPTVCFTKSESWNSPGTAASSAAECRRKMPANMPATARSAGFTSVNMGEMAGGSVALMIVLMVIGSAPGSRFP